MVLRNFKLFSWGVDGGEANGMICAEKFVTGEETEDCMIAAEVAATGSKKYYTASLFYMACVYIFSIIGDSQRKCTPSKIKLQIKVIISWRLENIFKVITQT